MARFTSVDDYVASLDETTRPVLARVREVVTAAVPGGDEVIRYDIPTVAVGGRTVVHYAAWKKHLSLYPAPPLGGPLDDELAAYREAKGTLRFPYAAGLPLDLISRTVAALVVERAPQG